MAATIGISLGDITAIGPEVALKAIAAELEGDDTRYVLIGDAEQTQDLNRALGLGLPVQISPDKHTAGRVTVLNPLPEPLAKELSPGSAAAARVAMAFHREGAKRAFEHEYRALVTAPVNKEAIIRAGIPFIGQTEFLFEFAGTGRTAMMLLGQDERGRWLRVVLATTHVPLRAVADQLTKKKVELAIELASEACNELGLQRARIGVCGLNPHAGEGGELGNEELLTIGPVVSSMRHRQIDAVGPLSADALFYSAYKGDYDAVVAMYHDQGLAPLKMVAFEQGVNWTLGLPFIRTSPDHGTAYDIAGQGKANPSSMIAAIRLAKKLAATRRKEIHDAV